MSSILLDARLTKHLLTIPFRRREFGEARHPWHFGFVCDPLSNELFVLDQKIAVRIQGVDFGENAGNKPFVLNAQGIKDAIKDAPARQSVYLSYGKVDGKAVDVSFTVPTGLSALFDRAMFNKSFGYAGVYEAWHIAFIEKMATIFNNPPFWFFPSMEKNALKKQALVEFQSSRDARLMAEIVVMPTTYTRCNLQEGQR